MREISPGHGRTSLTYSVSDLEAIDNIQECVSKVLATMPSWYPTESYQTGLQGVSAVGAFRRVFRLCFDPMSRDGHIWCEIGICPDISCKGYFPLRCLM